MQRNARVGRLDDFRWIAALMVVAIHTSPLESINGTVDFILTRVLCRVAVPFFFMVTGYFVLGNRNRNEKVIKSIKNTGVLYLAATILYLPIQFYKLRGEGLEITDIPGEVLREIFFDGTFYHLWYFPAVIIGLVISYLLLSYCKKAAIPVAAILYLIGLFGDSYYGIAVKIPSINHMYEGIFSISSYTRNGIFYAPLFILMGAMTNEIKEKMLRDDREEADVKALYVLFFFFMCLLFMCIEGFILHGNELQRHDSMYLFLPVCMLYLFQYLMMDGAVVKKRGIFYQKGPMLLYLLHPFIIIVLRGFVKVTKLTFLLTVSPVYYMTVVAGSLCAVYLVLLLRRHMMKVKRNWIEQ